MSYLLKPTRLEDLTNFELKLEMLGLQQIFQKNKKNILGIQELFLWMNHS